MRQVFEVATRLARAMNPSHDRYGSRLAVAGVLGAAATAGRLVGLTPVQLQHALGIATSEAAGSRRSNVGTDTMPLHSGRAARSGLLSALLAARGFTADPQALETARGWLELFRGADRGPH